MSTAQQPLESRVERLEERVTLLGELPARIDALASLRREMRELNEETLREMRELHGETRREMRTLNEETRHEMRALNDETRREMQESTAQLRQEMHGLNDATRRHMLVLHEEISRLEILQEGGAPRRRRKKR